MGQLILNDEDPIEIQDGEPIKEMCEEAGLPFGCEEGVCGTCIIDIEEGMENLSPYTQEEEDFLGEMDSERLACQCRMKKGIVRAKF